MRDFLTLGETMVAFLPNTAMALRYVDSFGKAIAGAESNVAIGLAKLGHTAGWISRVGKDEFGEFIIREIRGEGVDTSFVIRDGEHPTGIMFKQFAGDNESSVFYYRKGSAASALCPSDIDERCVRESRVLLVSGITPALSDSCREATLHAVRLARRNGVSVCFDPNIRRKLWSESEAKEVLSPLLSQSDIVLIGMDEAELLTGEDSPRGAARALKGLGVKKIAVKLGSEGAFVADGDSEEMVAARPARVVDTIGAGDAFNSGFLCGLLEGKGIGECGRLGAIMGALAVSSRGDIEGLPSREKLERLAANVDEVRR